MNKEELYSVPLPEQTDTYTVISHKDIIEHIGHKLSEYGLVIRHENYSTLMGGEQLFGTITTSYKEDDEYFLSISFQNSYNKTLRFISNVGAYSTDKDLLIVKDDNLEWTRKHTGNALNEMFSTMDKQIEISYETYSKIIKDKKKLESVEVSYLDYSKFIGELYLYNGYLTTSQVSYIKRGIEDLYIKEKVNVQDVMINLWSLYEIMLKVISQVHITKKLAQQKIIHSCIMSLCLHQSVNEVNDLEEEEEVTPVNVYKHVVEGGGDADLSEIISEEDNANIEEIGYQERKETPIPRHISVELDIYYSSDRKVAEIISNIESDSVILNTGEIIQIKKPKS